MPLDPYARRFLDMMAMGGTAEPSVAGRRNALRNLARLSRPRTVTAVAVRDLSVPGPAGELPARLYEPAGAETALPGLVFFHGGGLVAGDLDTHDAICRTLVEAAGIRLLAVDYRLAPEHPFPAAIEDALAASRWALAHAEELGIDPDRLAIGGDSAGAGLAAVTCQEMRAAGDPAIAAQLLLCPVLDLAGSEPSRRDFAEGYFLDAATIARDLAALGVGEQDLADPRLSPLRAASLAGLPPAILHTAEFDIVRDGGTAYAGRLAEAGVPVRHTCHEGMIHYFYGLGGLIPSGALALNRIGAELATVLAA